MSFNGKQFCIYIFASEKNGTLYVGMTNDLICRIYEHKNELSKGFAAKYKVSKLVWYEVHESAMAAIEREKQLKNWRKVWRLELIEKMNSDWCGLYDGLV